MHIRMAALGRSRLLELTPGVGTNHDVAEAIFKTVMTNVPIAPQLWTQGASAWCTCSDFETPDNWCKHIAALGYELINRCEVDEFYPCTLRCCHDLPACVVLPHKRVREQQPQQPHGQVVICLDSDDDADGSCAARSIVLCCLRGQTMGHGHLAHSSHSMCCCMLRHMCDLACVSLRCRSGFRSGTEGLIKAHRGPKQNVPQVPCIRRRIHGDGYLTS